ncbi:hypothetical protein DUI87_27499 [Hirundo rustica rustica]|uniref:Peptidase A2 domain-containing protein n=1 Tax=Hirundo rustica rustica TaxID=333673 RepID=A0A3M0JB73_HIRRU|nr:hypothetical protein DUI87_27499 [Hirundo rustica rustica]
MREKEASSCEKQCKWRNSVGKLQEERGSSTRDDTSDGDDSRASSASGTIIGEQHSDALSRTICRIPSDPELLPPGAQCDLATSKVICFLDDNYAVIPTGVTGSSWKRQDFLIIGKDRSSVLGLVIYPSVISADHNDELTVLAKPHQPPLIIPPSTSIARAIALPPHAAEQVLPVLRERDPPSGEHMEVHASWVKHIGRDRPILVCELTQGDKTIAVKGMLDTGADVTVSEDDPLKSGNDSSDHHQS